MVSCEEIVEIVEVSALKSEGGVTEGAPKSRRAQSTELMSYSRRRRWIEGVGRERRRREQGGIQIIEDDWR